MKKVKERPILFSGPMVQAILAGRKTQTRRTIKPTQSTPRVPPLEMEPWVIDGWQEEDEEGRPYWAGSHPDYPTGKKWFTCPYGKRGERLWGREAALPDFPKEFSYYDWSWREVPEEYRSPGFVLYRASYPEPDKIRWHPSIHMPRWASRSLLEVVKEVRVERVQDITEADARAEGVPPNWVGDLATGGAFNRGWDPDKHGFLPAGWEKMPDTVEGAPHYTAREAFATWWDAINGAGAWDRNDWVWVVEFKRID